MELILESFLGFKHIKIKIMKKLFVLLMILGLTSCSFNKSELYKITDSFVESLSTTYQRYGLLNSADNSKTTEDGEYTVTPIGRLINVKINKSVSSEEYESLKKSLLNHYKGNSKVNDVYISNAGTIMIDCRN
jgi:aromatic ring-opening dioxygenase LigB subunit